MVASMEIIKIYSSPFLSSSSNASKHVAIVTTVGGELPYFEENPDEDMLNVSSQKSQC